MNVGWPDRVEQFLWRRHSSPALQPAIRLVQFLYAIIRDLFVGHLTLRATGLVYVTILSIVPVIAISFAVLKAFGFPHQLQPFLHSVLAPLGPESEQLSQHVIGFVENVHGKVLAGVGLALLFVTTVSMAEKVEDSFNFVWRVDRPRHILRKVSDYLAVLLLGPVVMAIAMALIAAVESTELLRQLAGYRPLGDLLLFGGRVAPYVLVCAAFTFVYWFMPNTRVRAIPAAVGGIIGGALWAAMGVLFAHFVATSTQTLTIYATFAIAIMALLWLYFCWLILLVGAQVSFYVQHPAYLRIGYRALSVGSRQREQMALTVMLLVATAFRPGGARPTIESAATSMGMPAIALTPVLACLEEAGLLARSERDDLLPNRDPAQILLRDILAAVREPQARDPLPEGVWPAVVADLGNRMSEAVDQSLGGTTLGDLVDRSQKS